MTKGSCCCRTASASSVQTLIPSSNETSAGAGPPLSAGLVFSARCATRITRVHTKREFVYPNGNAAHVMSRASIVASCSRPASACRRFDASIRPTMAASSAACRGQPSSLRPSACEAHAQPRKKDAPRGATIESRFHGIPFQTIIRQSPSTPAPNTRPVIH